MIQAEYDMRYEIWDMRYEIYFSMIYDIYGTEDRRIEDRRWK